MNYKLHEQGEGLAGLAAGVEVYSHEEGLLKIIECSERVHIPDGAGGDHYVWAALARANRDAAELTDEEFARLPRVRVTKEVAQ